MTFKCSKCGSENVSLMAHMFVSFPTSMYHNITKTNIAKKEFEVWSVDWPDTDVVCLDCSYSSGIDRVEGRTRYVLMQQLLLENMCRERQEAEPCNISFLGENRRFKCIECTKNTKAGEFCPQLMEDLEKELKDGR